MSIKAYAALKPKQHLEPFEYEPAELGSQDVEIRITHSGLCHSDLHIVNGDLGTQIFPVVPGHEIVGNISAIGSEVKHLNIGDRVSVGWERGSCLHCEMCMTGQENLCAENKATCVGNYGGFAEAVRLDGRFVYKVPDGLPSETAAPIMCGGITVYSPIRRFANSTSRVGVIGIGGLGHFALMFANKFGCEVTAFSTTPEKEEEAKQLGAHHFVNSKDSSQMKKAQGSLDLIVSTVNVPLNWGEYLDILKPNGSLCLVGLVSKPLEIPVFPLILGQRAVRGSVIGGRPMMREMLDFADRHNIRAMTEVMPMTQVNDAMEKLRNNKARYRIVLTNP